MSNKEISRTRPGKMLEVTPEGLASLAKWIVTADSESVSWEFPNLRDNLREWMKTHKSAKETRLAATRLECLALRRIATSGNSNRLSTHQERTAANWLAEMSESEFQEFLEKVDSEGSPYAIFLRVRADVRTVDSWFSLRDGSDFCHKDSSDPETISNAARVILEEIGLNGEPFTVAQAADKLLNRVFTYPANNMDHDIFDTELISQIGGEPFREVVRRVLRTPVGGDDVDICGRMISIPAYITFKTDDAATYQRISWNASQIWHLRQMTEFHEKQAREAMTKASELRFLLDNLTHVSEISGTTRVVDLVTESISVALQDAA